MGASYAKGKRINSMSEFVDTPFKMYYVQLGKSVVKHRAYLESQQYRILDKWITQERIYEAARQ